MQSNTYEINPKFLMNPLLNASEKVIYIVLFNECREHGYCELSQKVIATKSGLSLRTVQQLIKKLEDKKAIVAEQLVDEDMKCLINKRYYINPVTEEGIFEEANYIALIKFLESKNSSK